MSNCAETNIFYTRLANTRRPPLLIAVPNDLASVIVANRTVDQLASAPNVESCLKRVQDVIRYGAVQCHLAVCVSNNQLRERVTLGEQQLRRSLGAQS